MIESQKDNIDMDITPQVGSIDSDNPQDKADRPDLPGWNFKKLLKLRIDKGLSYNQIETLTGIPHSTLHERLKWIDNLIKNPEELDGYRDNRASILSSVELEMVRDMADETRRSKASLNNVAYAFGQLHMARRLEEGKSTSNLSVHATLIEVACAGKVEDAQDDGAIDV